MFKYITTVLVLSYYNAANGLNLLTNIFDTAAISVTFKMFTRETPIGTKFDDDTQLDHQKLVIFLVHGWIESPEKRWYGDLTEALLKNYDCVVMQTNWAILARMEYTMSVENTKIVGSKIGKTIHKLNEQGVPLNNFWVLGHSLGSHVGGFAGKTVMELANAKIRKIISFDAAGPLWEVPQKPENQRLSYNDAEIVVNIHTDGGFLGYKAPIGTIDIFANGGTRPQPGCDNAEFLDHTTSGGIRDVASLTACSHIKSHEYYIRALNGEGITMTKCDSLVSYENGVCEGNAKIGLNDDFDTSDEGLYYFTTDH